MWNVPKPTDPVAYSFRIFRNFDGAGGQFGDTSVNSTSTDQGQLSVYGALRSSDGALTVVAINKTTGAIQTSLSLANFSANSSAAVFTYSNANLAQIIPGSPVSVASNSVNYTFPAYSATVFVFTPASATPTATTTSLSASSTTPTTGQTVTFTAAVAPKSGSGSPTGTVTFSDGAAQIGSGAVSAGTATFSTSTLAAGAHSIAASYPGDTSFSASTSSALSVTVSAPTKTATTTSVSPSATQLTTAQTVTLNITVAPKTGNGIPTGSVTILDGQSQLAMPTLVAGAASFSTSTLAAGTHSITVNYSGDSNFAASTSALVSLTVAAPAKINTVTAISASVTQITAGGSITFTATVMPQSGSGTATGTITFLDAQTQIGSAMLASGSAQFSSASLATGSHSISATYSGDASYNASSSAATMVTVAVAPVADFSLSMSSPSLTLAAGASGTMTLTVTPENGFKQAVAFTCSGLPAGASCGFSPQSLSTNTGPASTILTIQTAAAAATAMATKLANENRGNGSTFLGAAAPMIRVSDARIAAFYIFLLGFAGIFGTFGGTANKYRTAQTAKFGRGLAASAVLAAILVTASCAGTATEKELPPAQNKMYTITVTASAPNTPTHAQSFTLTVTP
jgi:Bacterial Ig-like domain (group 3)